MNRKALHSVFHRRSLRQRRMEGLFVCYIDPDGAIAQFQRNDCSISPVEVVSRSGVHTINRISTTAPAERRVG